MTFFKKLFRKYTNSSDKDISSIKPVSAQAKDTSTREPKVVKANDVPDVEPIVVQAVEILFKGADSQKKALNSIRKYNRERDSANLKTTLALLKYSNGDLALFEKSAWQSHPHFWMDEISPIFRTVEDAEKWVKSLSEAQN